MIRIRRLCTLLPLLLLPVACDDAPTRPDPRGTPGPPSGPRLARTTSWVASDSLRRQTGEFLHDQEGRLVRWEFSHNLTGEWRTTQRKDFLYQEDGAHAGHDHHIHLDGAWRLTRVVRYAYDERRGLPVRARVEEIEERTGDVVESTWEFAYDGSDRVVEMRRGTDVLRFTYDQDSDIVEIRGGGGTLARLTHGDAVNPLADLPPQHGIPGGIFAPDHFSRHLSESWSNGLEGQPPASMGAATVRARGDGFPTRREFTFWNTADPIVRTVAITEYEYLDPPR